MEKNNAQSGIVFEIERFAINDGPGIRSIVFLKGCPLRCKWCANPESQKPGAQLMYWVTRCMGCRRCIGACPNHALGWTGERIAVDREKCTVCGSCTDACNSEALTSIGRRMTVEDVMQVVSRDESFYARSGGGITFSGGEVFGQPAFLAALAAACKQRGYHTCVETSGYAPWESIAQAMEHIDLFLYDFKCMDAVVHKANIGMDNERIQENYKKLVELGKEIVARVPVIPGVNNSDGNFRALGEFLRQYNPGCRIDLLPYHRLGVTKYDRLDMGYTLAELEPPPKAEMEAYRRGLEEMGFYVTIGGL